MRSIRAWVLATFILSFLVIIAGGVVRTTQSGMGCPDWPKCFGRWIPPTNVSELPSDFEKYLRKQDIDHTFNVYHTWIEYFNRLLGVLLGMFAVIQCFVIYKKRKTLKQPFRLALLFLGLVILTGLFGAMVVKLNLAHLSISVHLLLAIVLVQVQLALLLSLQNKISAIPVRKRFKNTILFFLILLVVQSVLGTLVRMYIDDVSKILHYEQREIWLADMPVAFLIHRTFSWVVLLAGFYVTWVNRNETVVAKKLHLLLSFILLNMIAGIVLFYADMPAIAQPIHLLLASFSITQTMNLLLQTQSSGTQNVVPGARPA